MRVNRIRKRIVCNDGVSLSVQANEHAYCHPRDNDGPWEQVEIGFIRNPDGQVFPAPDYLAEFGEIGDGVYSDVYPYVPVDIVERFIAEHGGRKIWV